MAAKLIVEEGDLKGLSLSLEGGEAWTIGRDPDECQLVIEDPLVSRKHLLARRTPEGIVIKNLSHTNPALLNDEEIDDQAHVLQNGDTLKIGNETLRFYEDSSAHVLAAAPREREDADTHDLEESETLLPASDAEENIEVSSPGKEKTETAPIPKEEVKAAPLPKEEMKTAVPAPKEEIKPPLVPEEELKAAPAPTEIQPSPVPEKEIEAAPLHKEEIQAPLVPEEEIQASNPLPETETPLPKEEMTGTPPAKEEIEAPPTPEKEMEAAPVLSEEIEAPLIQKEEIETPLVPEEEIEEEIDTPLVPEKEMEAAPKANEEIEAPLTPEEEIGTFPVPENETADTPANEIDDSPSHERDNPMTNEEKMSPSEAPPAPLFAPQPSSPPPSSLANEQSGQQDTVFGDENDQLEGSLAEIDFGVIETGRWLLKVIGGPNNGAEFYMQAGNNYVIGTDQQGCDIVFHDTSVSRHHARITVSPEDTLSIEDLKSRNGVLVNGTLIENKQELTSNTIVTLGTTSFIVYDREGEMQTIISPLLPSIMKALKQEPEKSEQEEQALKEAAEAAEKEKAMEHPQVIETPPPPKRSMGSYIVLSTILGFFLLAGIGTFTLFRDEPVVTETYENAEPLIKQTLQPFPAIRWTFNKSNGGLLLLGHVTTLAEKNQLLYNLGTLKFIKNIDDNGIIIDEGVWNEINSLLANNPAWKGITVHSTSAGSFILTGELKTRKQSEQLSSYLSLNFPYLDLLKKEIVVEEDVVNQIQGWLQDDQLTQVTPTMANDEVVLSGTAPPEKTNELNGIIAKIKQIPGVRVVSNLVRSYTVETIAEMNISSQYPVTGHSRIGNKYTVVINGHILSEGGELDGMNITKITSNRVYLEKEGDKFRIDY